MNTLNEGPCTTGHAWRRLQHRVSGNKYLCNVCGFFGYKNDGSIVQSIRHVEQMWFDVGQVFEDSDLPDVATASVSIHESLPETEPDWRTEQVEQGVYQHRFIERNVWRTSLDTLPKDRSRSL